MCRIVALIGGNTSYRAELMHQMMLYASAEPYQVDGFGITDGINVIKSDKPYYQGGVFTTLTESQHPWLGHVRNASIGSELSVSAAHPYLFKNVHCVHNGFFDMVPHTYELKGPKTDSFEAFVLLTNIMRKNFNRNYSLSALAQAVPTWFSFMYSSQFAIGLHLQNRIIFLRNEARTLYVTMMDTLTLVHTSGEALENVSEWAYRYKGVPKSEIVLLPANELIEIDKDRTIRREMITWDWASKPIKAPRKKKR